MFIVRSEAFPSVNRKPFRENSSHFSIVRVIYTNLIWLLFVAQEPDANSKKQRKTRQLKLFLQQATLKTSPQVNVPLPESTESSLLLNSFLTLSRYEIKITNNCREGSLMLKEGLCAGRVTWSGLGKFIFYWDDLRVISLSRKWIKDDKSIELHTRDGPSSILNLQMSCWTFRLYSKVKDELVIPWSTIFELCLILEVSKKFKMINSLKFGSKKLWTLKWEKFKTSFWKKGVSSYSQNYL